MKTRARMRLIEARKQRRWSQQELAGLLGTTQHNVSRWEGGKTTPGPYFRAKLCELFGKSAQELDLVEQGPLPSGASAQADERTEQTNNSSVDGLWMIPYPRNPYFTGRDRILQQVHTFLHSEQTAILSQSCTISGLGGIGKTQVALEYAYRYADDYAAIFWISAETPETILTSFAALATLLNLSEKQEREQERVVAAVLHWLTTRSQWLLIFDNVEHLGLVKRYVPAVRHGSLLFTTRMPALGISSQIMDLEKMPSEEALRFFFQRTRLLEPGKSLESLAPADQIAAQAIIAHMDGLPLALDQAGAYIEATRCSLRDYWHLLQSSPFRLLALREAHADHPLSVSHTFLLAFEQIERDCPAAAELLTVCAFLAAEAIPETFFLEGAVHLGSTFEALSTDPLQFQDALKVLLNYSLLQRDPASHTLTIHRLVQTVLKGHLPEPAQRTWAQRIIRAMTALFPSTKVQSNYLSIGEQLLSHALTCLAFSGQWDIDLAERVTLSNHVATYFYHRAQFAKAESLYQQARALGEQEFGSEHLLVAQTLLGLANIAKDQGKFNQAEQLYLQALSIREHALGPEHPLISPVLNNLALLSEDQGKYQQAEELHWRALRIREQAQGPDDPLVATTLNNLAVVFMEQGKYEQAEALAQRALHITEHKLGPTHPQTAFPLTNLAEIFQHLGKYEAAEPLYQRALQIREQSQGPEHPEVAYLVNRLATLATEQGKEKEAEALFQRALHLREKSLGPQHPAVAESLHGLATLYARQRREREAEALYKRALHVREQSLDLNHPLVAKTLHSLATLYTAQDKREEAFPLYQRALAIREQALGTSHPKTIETRTHLCAVLQAMGKSEEAALLQAVQMEEAMLEKEQP